MAGSHSHEGEAPVAGREAASAAAPTLETLSAAAAPVDCEKLIALANGLLAKRCAGKVNILPHAGEHVHTGCKCSGGGGDEAKPFLADLIVLIDTSGSMAGAAGAISAAAEAAVKAAQDHCKVDLRIAFMGVEGTWPGTVFATDYLVYLKGLPGPDPAFSTDNPPGMLGSEEGANAIEDLSKYYDWRPDACRAIFYISDEKLDSISSNEAGSKDAVDKAVSSAIANDVTVFAHFVNHQPEPAWVQPQYQDLCSLTGGELFVSPTPSKAEYEKILADAICGSCGKPRCQAVEAPKLEPCISVSWGDSRCDCFETDDVETVCVTVCNCYSNITFSNFRIAAAIVTGAGGAAMPLLPDGTPSVQMIPLGPVCFGDIPPCRDDKAGCISREYVIRTRGAKGGKYDIRLLGICYDVNFHYVSQDSFALTLCQD
jgi:hypothetical protein